MFKDLKDYFAKAFQFRGRATRKEYWVPNIVLGLSGIGLAAVRAPQQMQNVLGALISIPMISLTSRRYQDAGVSGWFQLPQLMSFLLMPLVFMSFIKRGAKAAVITVIALFNITGFILTLLPSDGNNRFGRRP
ncbi:hypothetical protein WN59_12695 [Salinicoccus sediminis]|uniref:DUF805 domain-containing protein n=1 Tax=Salinicoccus sediminis TaxID=1432562 RepID=A0A0M2SF55_9STAP|nr:DUF805 domain-containing protein [Salinicoccus sediminis]KKK32903.1 hypothetical protein WN59_12695 [Salinicoccus sediminis]